MSNLVVVAGALISGASLLVAQRDRPPELAGLWELPGGKVAPGETDQRALRWVGVDELDDLPWVPADRAWVPDLTARLGSDPAIP